MTTTTAISGQPIGTSTNYGTDKFPQKVTLTTGTTAFAVEGRITNGASGYPDLTMRIWYAVSAFDMTAAASVDACRVNARYVDLPFNPNSNSVRVRTSLLEPAHGAYLYLWCEVPALTVAATLDVSTVELP